MPRALQKPQIRSEVKWFRGNDRHAWGRPQANDVRLFETICLEGFQSGLSWLTILGKRDAFRAQGPDSLDGR